jgi:two-component system KDP operon response regulator KdpE
VDVERDARVLVVDDEPAIRDVLDAALRARGYATRLAIDGSEALELASAVEPDVVVLDLGLPDLDGVEVCRQLRRWTSNPIIVLTVDDGENRKVEALDAGADDYVTKPFSVPELLARVRVALRHRAVLAQAVDATAVDLGELRVDTAAYEAYVGAEALRLTRKEFALLAVLARNAGKVLAHDTLLAAAWGEDASASRRGGQLRTHVTQLRNKLAAVHAAARIVSEPGVGYRLVATERDADALER